MAPHRYRWLTGEEGRGSATIVSLIGLKGEVLKPSSPLSLPVLIIYSQFHKGKNQTYQITIDILSFQEYLTAASAT